MMFQLRGNKQHWRWRKRWDNNIEQPTVKGKDVAASQHHKSHNTYTTILSEIWKLVICQWIRVREPSFIISLWIHGALSIWTTWTTLRIPSFFAMKCKWNIQMITLRESISSNKNIELCVILPFFATKRWINKQVVRFITFRCHPILVISPPDTVQFIDQVRKPAHTMACLGARIGRCISWQIRPLSRVRWKHDWGMWIFALLQTSRGTGKMGVTAFWWHAVDLKIIRVMHFWFAIAMT